MGRCCSNVPMPRIETLWAAVENCSPPSHYILQWNLRTRDILGAMLLSLVERSSLSRRVIFFPLLTGFIQLFHDHTHPSPATRGYARPDTPSRPAWPGSRATSCYSTCNGKSGCYWQCGSGSPRSVGDPFVY